MKFKPFYELLKKVSSLIRVTGGLGEAGNLHPGLWKIQPRLLENPTQGLGPPRLMENSTQAFGRSLLRFWKTLTAQGTLLYVVKEVTLDQAKVMEGTLDQAKPDLKSKQQKFCK